MAASPTPLGSFVLGVLPPAAAPLRKRAISGLVSSSGGIVDWCNLAAKFNIVDGELMSNSGYLSTNVGVAFAPLALSLNKGPISNTFTVINNKLRWENSAFASGVALYCMSTDGVVLAVFNGIYPQGCVVINLAVVQASECLEAISSPTTVSSSTTSINTSSGTSTSVSTKASTSSSASTDSSSLSSTSVPTTTSSGTSTTLATTTTTSATSATSTALCNIAVQFREAVLGGLPSNTTLKIIGSITELGSWNVDLGVPLSFQENSPEAPVWSVTIDIAPNVTIYWNYIQVNSSGAVRRDPITYSNLLEWNKYCSASWGSSWNWW